MEYQSFSQIVEAVQNKAKKHVLAIAGAAEQEVLEAARHARKEGIVEPLLVGDSSAICAVLRGMRENPADWSIEHAETGMEASVAVDLARNGVATALMKGAIETKDLLQPLVKKENGLRSGATMSHVVFFDHVPGLRKLIVVSDGGMILYPTLADKKAILENAVGVLRAIGYTRPKVAVITAVEKVHPNMIESVEAETLCQMNRNGEIQNCVVEGPISYDVAMSPEIARHKGYRSENPGDFDVFIMPNMNAGNILGKCWTVTCGALMGGIVTGAKVPVVLTSRGSSAQEKFNSIALAALVSSGSGYMSTGL